MVNITSTLGSGNRSSMAFSNTSIPMPLCADTNIPSGKILFKSTIVSSVTRSHLFTAIISGILLAFISSKTSRTELNCSNGSGSLPSTT